MKAFITGVAGFIGSHVAEALLERGWQVAGVDNLLTGRADNIPAGVAFHEGDIVDRFHTDGADLIVHCAASYDNPDKWHRDSKSNVLGSINVGIAARECGARVFYFQTSLPPVSSYAISKIAGQQYLELSGVPLVTFRLANIYGPRNVSGPIPAFYKRLTAGQACTVVRTQRDMVFVGDLVAGVMRAVDRPEVAGTVDMCSGHDLWISELYDAVAGELGSDAVAAVVDPADDDVPKMHLNGSRARNELGWEPVVSLRSGVREAVRWYAEHGVDRTFTHLRLKDAA